MIAVAWVIAVASRTAGEPVCPIARVWDRIAGVAEVSAAAEIELATGAWGLALEVVVALEVPEALAERAPVPAAVEVFPAWADLVVAMAAADLAVAAVAVAAVAVAVAGGNKL